MGWPGFSPILRKGVWERSVGHCLEWALGGWVEPRCLGSLPFLNIWVTQRLVSSLAKTCEPPAPHPSPVTQSHIGGKLRLRLGWRWDPPCSSSSRGLRCSGLSIAQWFEAGIWDRLNAVDFQSPWGWGPDAWVP